LFFECVDSLGRCLPWILVNYWTGFKTRACEISKQISRPFVLDCSTSYSSELWI